jgi:hypothetical protein
MYFMYGMWNSKLRQGIVVEGHEPEPFTLPHDGV